MHNRLTPKFSIITVTYNAEAVLEDTILSVISQTYHHIEYIIIDGASKDRTLSIAERYRDRITQIVSEPDKGLYDAMKASTWQPVTIFVSSMPETVSTKMTLCSRWYIPWELVNCRT